MESLVPVMLSGDNVAVGVSGFGSAAIDPSRWVDLSLLTGRTTFQLRYDSQRLPWVDVGTVKTAALLPFGPLPLVFSVSELYRRWKVARSGATVASDHLATWISRWCLSDRSVTLVGFSLGAYLIWEAMKKVPKDLWPMIDVVFVSGALADRPDQWDSVERLSSLTNVYSSNDLVLSWLYPQAVDAPDSAAVGLGPVVPELPNVRNIDLTDTIGRDHLWAGGHLPSILRTVLGISWAGREGRRPIETVDAPGEFGAEAIDRLSSWTICVPRLWEAMGLAMGGDPGAIHDLLELDRWSLEDGRITALLNAGATIGSLYSDGGQAGCRQTAVRSITKVEGLILEWMDRTIR